VVGPLAIFALAQFVLAWLGNTEVALPQGCCDPTLQLTANEAAARMRLLGSMLLFLLFALGAIFVVGYDLRRIFAPRVRNQLLWTGVIGLAVVVVIRLLGLFLGWPEPMSLIGSSAFAEALKVQDAFSSGPWGEGWLSFIIWIYSIFIALAATALIVGLISCLAQLDPAEDPATRQRTPPTADELKDNWIWQSERVQMYIYIATALLVLGILAVKFWTSYPAFIFTGDTAEANVKAHAAVVDAFAIYQGIEYSLMLAAIVLPVTWLLTWEADQIAKAAIDDDAKRGVRSLTPMTLQIQVKKEEKKLALTPMDALKLIAAVLAPLLAGTLSSLTGLLPGG
jgi:hypothetical protein